MLQNRLNGNIIDGFFRHFCLGSPVNGLVKIFAEFFFCVKKFFAGQIHCHNRGCRNFGKRGNIVNVVGVDGFGVDVVCKISEGFVNQHFVVFADKNLTAGKTAVENRKIDNRVYRVAVIFFKTLVLKILQTCRQKFYGSAFFDVFKT